jgi:molybdopterin synthase catalytic subunit
VEGDVSIRIDRRPLSVAAAYRQLERPGLGGVVLFVGRVRPDRTSAGTVEALDYEAHVPVARVALRALERAAVRRARGGRFVLWHRLGRLRVGVVSVIVGAATAHRAEAFRLARWLIDRLKSEVPIWKMDRARRARQRRRRPRPRAGR